MKHRRPVLLKVPKGQCRWCGEAILKPDGTTSIRLHWHPVCVQEFKIAAWSAEQRRAVFKRDKGICAACGLDTHAERRQRFAHDSYHNSGRLWQADHIRPLIEGNRDREFFRLSNLQTLCTKCHKIKTAQDIRRYRAGLKSIGDLAVTLPLPL